MSQQKPTAPSTSVPTDVLASSIVNTIVDVEAAANADSKSRVGAWTVVAFDVLAIVGMVLYYVSVDENIKMLGFALTIAGAAKNGVTLAKSYRTKTPAESVAEDIESASKEK